MKTRVAPLVVLAIICCAAGFALEPGLPAAGVACKADKLDRPDDQTLKLSGNVEVTWSEFQLRADLV